MEAKTSKYGTAYESGLVVSPGGLAEHTALSDRWARPIRYLRLSVTDRCNLRCTYCMPADGWEQVHRTELMTLEEMSTFVGIMAELGVEKVRLTGGEPLLRKGIVDLVGWIAQTPGIKQVAMTTNGYGLTKMAQSLWDAGLRSLNVSLDSFDPLRFSSATRGGDVERVLKGLRAARDVGFEDIRINCVAIRGLNHTEHSEFVRRCWDEGWLPRFIELMPIGGLDEQGLGQRISSEEMIAALKSVYDLAEIEKGKGLSGPARYLRVQSGPYTGSLVGTISPMTDTGFCGDCNRVRLMARGGFRSCLANDDEVSILEAMRNQESRSTIVELIKRAVDGKLEAHRMSSGNFVPLSIMTGIGG